MSWRGIRYVAIANFDSICLCHSLDRKGEINGSSNGYFNGSFLVRKGIKGPN